MLTSIESAMIARINNSVLVTGGFVKTVESYQHVMKQLEQKKISSLLPAVFIMYTGGPTEKVTQKYNHVSGWSLIVAVQNLRKEKDRRTKASVGAYDIISSLLALFVAHNLGIAIYPIILKGIESHYDKELEKQGIALYSINLETSFIIEPVSDETVTDLLNINLKYYLQDPADDGVEDAEDSVTLPGP